MPQTLLDMNGFKALLSSPPVHSITLPVNREVDLHIRANADNGKMRAMTDPEVATLAALLDEVPGALEGPFFVDQALVCPNCKRNLTFADFIKTVMGVGSHSRQMITSILTGRNGVWVTFAGTEEVRTITCLDCDCVINKANHNYHSSAYNYYAF